MPANNFTPLYILIAGVVLTAFAYWFIVLRPVKIGQRQLQKTLELADRCRRQNIATQERVAGRIRRGLRKVCNELGLKIEQNLHHEEEMLHIYEADVPEHLFGQRSVVHILVNHVDPKRPLPIFFRYAPSLAPGYWSDTDEEVDKLIEELTKYLLFSEKKAVKA